MVGPNRYSTLQCRPYCSEPWNDNVTYSNYHKTVVVSKTLQVLNITAIQTRRVCILLATIRKCYTAVRFTFDYVCWRWMCIHVRLHVNVRFSFITLFVRYFYSIISNNLCGCKLNCCKYSTLQDITRQWLQERQQGAADNNTNNCNRYYNIGIQRFGTTYCRQWLQNRVSDVSQTHTIN